jgi:hypothetical protein
MTRSWLNLRALLPCWPLGVSKVEVGTCPICHCLVDMRAEAAHLWWHENGQPKNGVGKVGKHV